METGPGPIDAANRAFIQDSAWLFETDRAAAVAMAPRSAHDDLITLAAYLGDVRRIPLTVSDATLGEIRLQWWRDTLQAGVQGGLSGNPIADGMVRVIARHALPLASVLAPLEAASAELTGEPFEDEAAWLAYLDSAEGAGFRLSAATLGAPACSDSSPCFEPAGRAYATIRLAVRLPELLSRHRWPVPPQLAEFGDPRSASEADARAIVRQAGDALAADAAQYLEGARQAVAQSPRDVLPAIITAALVPSYAKAIVRPRRDALREPAQIAPLVRFLRLWWASRTHKI